MIYKTCLILIPIVVMVVWSILGEVAIKSFDSFFVKSVFLAITGVIGGGFIYWMIKFFSTKAGISLPNIGDVKMLAFGCLLGLAVSVLAGFLFYLTEKPKVEFNSLDDRTAIRFIGNISPAVVEEITFRGGVVHSVSIMTNNTVGLMSGSLPFGLIHLVGRLLGKPVGVLHVIGVTAAGLLLSLAYLRFGLMFAIGVHWIWNSLCGTWVSIFGLPKNGGVQMIEGAWTTVLVLLLFVAIIYFLPGAGRITLSGNNG